MGHGRRRYGHREKRRDATHELLRSPAPRAKSHEHPEHG
jgi:hypothetical protein